MQYHQSTAFPRLVAHSSRPGGFLELAELIDLHLALGEDGFDLQLASHGSNHGLQSADVHIGAALHLGDRRLIGAKQVEGLAEPTRRRPDCILVSHLSAKNAERWGTLPLCMV
jgi:hypothetical protein